MKTKIPATLYSQHSKAHLKRENGNWLLIYYIWLHSTDWQRRNINRVTEVKGPNNMTICQIKQIEMVKQKFLPG